MSRLGWRRSSMWQAFPAPAGWCSRHGGTGRAGRGDGGDLSDSRMRMRRISASVAHLHYSPIARALNRARNRRSGGRGRARQDPQLRDRVGQIPVADGQSRHVGGLTVLRGTALRTPQALAARRTGSTSTTGGLLSDIPLTSGSRFRAGRHGIDRRGGAYRRTA